MKNNIIGVFPADRITRLEEHKGLIVNTKPFGHEGEHWLAVYNDGGRVEIFDSLGSSNNKYRTDFHKLADDVCINQIAMQCNDSLICGHYSIFYLFCRVRNISHQDFLDTFSPYCKMNDAYVLRFIRHTFSLCLTNHA
jgi:hypothetical protein